MRIVRKISRIVASVVLILLAIFLAAVFLFDVFVQFRDTDQALATFFKKSNVPATIGYYNSHGRTIRQVTVGNRNAPVSIVFLHGAPSSLSYFKKYFTNDTLLKTAYMVAVDRPGYGYSGFGRPETSMQLQAKMIRPVLDSLKKLNKPIILVGVSYGTSIAARITMDYPELVDGMVLVAPSVAPGEEKIYSVAYPIQFPMLQWAVPRMLLSANEEKLSHRSELEKMVPLWKNIRVPVIYLQGKNDGLIYPSNADFARRHLVNAACLDIEMIPNRGHLIMFSEIKKIKQAIIDMTHLSAHYYNRKAVTNARE